MVGDCETSWRGPTVEIGRDAGGGSGGGHSLALVTETQDFPSMFIPVSSHAVSATLVFIGFPGLVWTSPSYVGIALLPVVNAASRDW